MQLHLDVEWIKLAIAAYINKQAILNGVVKPEQIILTYNDDTEWIGAVIDLTKKDQQS